MALMPQQIDDLVNLTYERSVKKLSWQDISFDLQFHTVAQRYFRSKKMPVNGSVFQRWDLQTEELGNARNVGLYNKDVYEAKNLMKKATQDWIIINTNYIYDVNEPEFQGTDYTLIVKSIEVREHATLMNWFKHAEHQIWGAPTSEDQNPKDLSGIPFWLQKSATAGFNGGNPAGFPGGAAGVDANTYPNWKNYTFTYDQVTRTNIVREMRKAIDFCYFEAPDPYNELTKRDPNWMFFTTHRLKERFAELRDTQNDNIRDLAGMAHGMFDSIPLRWVPALTHSTSPSYDGTDPIYGINWSTMKFEFLKGKERVRTGPSRVQGMNNVRAVHYDSFCNLKCLNRRANFVGYNKAL